MKTERQSWNSRYGYDVVKMEVESSLLYTCFALMSEVYCCDEANRELVSGRDEEEESGMRRRGWMLGLEERLN